MAVVDCTQESGTHLYRSPQLHIESAACIMHQLLCCDPMPCIYHDAQMRLRMLQRIHGTPAGPATQQSTLVFDQNQAAAVEQR
jgi:hypothetical protein